LQGSNRDRVKAELCLDNQGFLGRFGTIWDETSQGQIAVTSPAMTIDR
jgi:hypothetical protein